MRLPPTEQFILSLLANDGASYGLQLVESSRGRLKRGGIYVTLGKMEEKGLVSSSLQPDGRRIYELKGLGHRALAAMEIMGDVERGEAMTGPLYVVVRWFLSILPVDVAGRRVFDETLADWKSEAAKASGPLGSVTVSLRAVVSVFRSIVMISSKELSTREGLAPLLRLATWSLVSVLLFVAFNWNWSIPVEGVQVRIGSTAVLLGSVSSVLAFLPLVAFVSTATGRRAGAQVPRLGPALVAGLVMLGAMGWGMPAANQAWRELMFALSGGSGAILPGINERSIVELIGMLPGEKLGKIIAGLNVRLMFMVAVPVMLVLGVTARALQGRRRIAGSVLPVLLLLLPFSSPNTYGLVGWWPALLAAVLVTRALARAERDAGRDDRLATRGRGVIRFARFLLSVVALDVRGHRAVAATMADWEHELSRAASARRRLLVNWRSTFGVARTLTQVGVADFTTAAVSSFFWRLAALAGLWVAWRLSTGMPAGTERFFLVTSDAKAWTLVAASLLQQGLVVFPLMVFLAEALGHRNRVTPVAGTLAVLAVIGAVVGLVVLPVSATYLRYETWRYFANASVPEPGVGGLLLSFLSIFATISTVAGIWLLFVFANRIRRVGGVTGWGMGFGVVGAVYGLGILLQFVPLPIDVRVAVMISGPILMVAAILWATTRLAKIEDARASTH